MTLKLTNGLLLITTQFHGCTEYIYFHSLHINRFQSELSYPDTADRVAILLFPAVDVKS